MHGNPLLFPPLIAAFELLIAFIFETRVVLGLGREPTSRLLAGVVRYVPRPEASPKAAAAVAGVLLAVCQVFPLGQERLFGGSQPPDHISGIGVIIVEMLLGAWLWFDTHREPASQI